MEERSAQPFQQQPDDYAVDLLVHATATHSAIRRATTRTGHARDASGQESTYSMISNRRMDQQTINRVPGAPSPSQIITGLGPDVLSSRSSMDAGVFHPGIHSGGPSAYMMHGYHGSGPQLSPLYANEHLGILSAESYDEGNRGGGSNEVAMNQQQQRVLPFGITTAPRLDMGTEQKTETEGHGGGRRRKKPRVEVQSAEEDEDVKKKARGRPRVDTKDETAADRRRTQIRMAQRAYRNRKETTISSLEKQVQDLKGTNEEMSNIFISFYDFAVGRGLLQREPGIGSQLQAATERFLALAKASSNEDLSQDDHELEEPKREPPEPTRQTGRKTKSRPPSLREEQQQVVAAAEPTQPWGGYVAINQHRPAKNKSSTFQPQDYRHDAYPRDVEVVTRPTEDNASFPCNPTDFTNIQACRLDVPPFEFPSADDFSTNFYPYSQLPLPKSYNYTELSFGRRLQRAALERALTLLTSPNPPPGRFDAVFGFCMLYESKETMTARIKALVARKAKESLQEWRAPFVHLGGAGTFYPVNDNSVNGDLMPKLRTGYSMGPFSQPVTEAQSLLDEDMRINMPGFDGDFFDPNDVEGYLRGRGLDIRPAADFVTGDVDFEDLPEDDSANSNESSSSIPAPETPIYSANKIPINQSQISVNQEFDPFEASFKSNAFFTPSDANGAFSQIYNWDTEGTTKGPSTAVDPISDRILAQQPKRANAGATKAKRTVTISVENLINEILGKVVCLTRCPAFRVPDVNAALVAAVKAGT